MKLAVVGFTGFAVVLGASLVAYRLHLNAQDEAKATTEATVSEPSKPEPPAPPPKPPTLDEALKRAKFGDSVDGKLFAGAGSFLYWAARYLTVDDLVDTARPATSFQELARDADLERGKRLCVTGEVIQIAGEDQGGVRVYDGGIWDKDKVVRFTAVGSVEGIYEQKRAMFCGIAIGRESFVNTFGVEVQAVRAVGMFVIHANDNHGKLKPAPSTQP